MFHLLETKKQNTLSTPSTRSFAVRVLVQKGSKFMLFVRTNMGYVLFLLFLLPCRMLQNFKEMLSDVGGWVKEKYYNAGVERRGIYDYAKANNCKDSANFLTFSLKYLRIEILFPYPAKPHQKLKLYIFSKASRVLLVV